MSPERKEISMTQVARMTISTTAQQRRVGAETGVAPGLAPGFSNSHGQPALAGSGGFHPPLATLNWYLGQLSRPLIQVPTPHGWL